MSANLFPECSVTGSKQRDVRESVRVKRVSFNAPPHKFKSLQCLLFLTPSRDTVARVLSAVTHVGFWQINQTTGFLDKIGEMTRLKWDRHLQFS